MKTDLRLGLVETFQTTKVGPGPVSDFTCYFWIVLKQKLVLQFLTLEVKTQNAHCQNAQCKTHTAKRTLQNAQCKTHTSKRKIYYVLHKTQMTKRISKMVISSEKYIILPRFF